MTHKHKMTYALNVSSLGTYIGCVKVCSNKKVLIYDINIHNGVAGMNPGRTQLEKIDEKQFEMKIDQQMNGGTVLLCFKRLSLPI